MAAAGLQLSDIGLFELNEAFAAQAWYCVRELGIDAIRLTGGEPTVRAHLPVLVERLAALGTDLSITTNAVTLDVHAAPLAAAGLRRANISLDTLRADRFLELTRRPELDRVLAGADSFGFNALTGQYGDMVAMGILDPCKVTRTALQNAASIASLLLTTEAIVADKPEPAGAGGGGMPGGMGGMGGGMDF